MMVPGPPEAGTSPGRQPPAAGGPDIRVDRTCTEVQPDGSRSNTAAARPLSDFRAVPAYVLLGDPGAGKTTEFERECEALGDAAVKMSARRFVTFDPPRPEWWNKTLLIDGLDEMRAGATTARSPLDKIRHRLHQLEQPRFRLSCREADWLGNNDLQALAEVSPDSRITVLRLDPLSQSASRELLIMKHPALDSQKLVGEALQRGIHSMLDNPLTLNLLAEAVGPSGDLPGSRLETFETACRSMAREHNEEHRSTGTGHPLESLIDASGYLCALLLLSGCEVCSCGPGNDLRSCISLDDLRDVTGHPSLQALFAALGTKLFKGADGTGFVPLHRQVAEFLAGRYLAKCISSGLPAGRVVAQMTGDSDGRVVTVLRGLSAWLAAHSREARQILVDADPVGVALYGDIRGFTTHDKQRLLRALAQLTPHQPIFDYEQPESVNDPWWVDMAWAFRSLASADMVGPIKELINRQGPQAPDDRLELLILGAISEAGESDRESLSCLLPQLEALVRDAFRPTGTRRSALDAYRHILGRGNDRVPALVQLLEDLHEDADSDPDGELRGTLLADLYPTAISSSDLWRYALGAVQRDYFIRAARLDEFWEVILPTQSSDHQVAELLDALHDNASSLVPDLEDGSFLDVPMKLLARGLRVFGEGLDLSHLYRWLSITGPYPSHADRADEPTLAFRAWLEAHPQLQKAVYLVWLKHWIEDDPAKARAWWFFDQPHVTTLPADFGLWCLEKAIEIGDSDPALSRALLGRSFWSLEEPSLNEGLTLEVVRARTSGHRALMRRLKELCRERSERKDPTLEPHIRRIKERQEQRREEERQRQQEWAQHLRSHETELRENRFSPPDLHNLAKQYLGLFANSDPQTPPRHRVADFVGGNEVAVDAALVGLRGAVRREDVPDVEETISLYLGLQQSRLSYPVLASLHLLDEEDPASLDSLDEAIKRKALTIHYCVPLGHPHPEGGRIVRVGPLAWNDPSGGDEPRGWHDRWLHQDPELVLDVLYRCAVEGIRHAKDLPPGLSDLVAVTSHIDLVHDLCLRLLRAFPTRVSSARLPLLEELLTRVLNHWDGTALRDLVEQKLSLTSLTVGQRVRWLAVDAAISPSPGLPRLKSFVGDSEVRARHLAEVLRHPVEYIRDAPDHPRSIRSILAGSRDPATLKAQVEMLGQVFRPTEWGGYVTLEKATSEHLGGLIARLGSLAGDDARPALQTLIEDSRLASWRGHLGRSRERQLVVHRDASYRHPTVERIQRTLDGGAPANAADLAELLTDRLADIAANIRGGNSNLWRQFWNEDSYGRLPQCKPDESCRGKPEESCRDALLENLQLRLPAEVDVVPEGRYAAAKRADIRAACDGFNVPIEIKKNSHPDLWSALRTQLIGKYTTDPATAGYGIYLVLWFGADETTRPPNATRPVTPQELKQQLESRLTAGEARKISVIVMDVTKPDDRRDSGTQSERRLNSSRPRH